MTTAETCILVAGLLPYVATGLAKADRTYDNRNPRGWLAAASGWRARANAAQANGFEAFPLFAAGVLCAEWRHVAQGTVDALAIAFIVARLAYLGLYLADRSTLRSVVWTVGMGCAVALFLARPVSPF